MSSTCHAKPEQPEPDAVEGALPGAFRIAGPVHASNGLDASVVRVRGIAAIAGGHTGRPWPEAGRHRDYAGISCLYRTPASRSCLFHRQAVVAETVRIALRKSTAGMAPLSDHACR
jgi:hypothetical protein